MAEKKETVVPSSVEYIEITPKKEIRWQCNEMLIETKIGIKIKVPKYLEENLKTEGVV